MKNLVLTALILMGSVYLFNIYAAGGGGGNVELTYPIPLEKYDDAHLTSLWDQLMYRVSVDKFNLISMIIFLLAILHAFSAAYFRKLSHKFEEAHMKSIKHEKYETGETIPVSFKAELFHFLGEVEAIFGIWVIPLIITFIEFEGWSAFRDYIGYGVNYAEPVFVVVIMVLASTRPIMKFSETIIKKISALFGSTIAAYWLTILTVGPILGSFITEPAAMTICAMLLGQSFYQYKPSNRLAYGTIGLLFVNISIGGTLTNFAAPPVLMVAAPWEWSTAYMFTHIGWKAVVAILISNILYFALLRGDINKMEANKPKKANVKSGKEEKLPVGILLIHLLFLAWTVLNSHYPALVVGGFLFFLAFAQATAHFQGPMSLKTPMLVGFFLAGLVTHGGLQGWWIAPTLQSLSEIPMFFGSVVLTAFNDNASITYLSTLVPNLSDELKYAVVTGAVTGGGLTVIANAPNPAGQAILSKFFPDNAVNPLFLLFGAMAATIISSGVFLLIP